MVLVDTCVWIDFFNNGEKSEKLTTLINLDLVSINEIILAEIIPTLTLKNQYDAIKSLKSFLTSNLNVLWDGIIQLQILNLKNGTNNVGLADLIITQNCIDENLELWSFDKHFSLMAQYVDIKLFTV